MLIGTDELEVVLSSSKDTVKHYWKKPGAVLKDGRIWHEADTLGWLVAWW